MKENWIIVKGWPNYAVSDLARIKSIRRRGSHNIIEEEKIIENNINAKNYLVGKFYGDGKMKGFYVHRVVALHFCDKTEEQTEVHHIDGNTLNNLPSNLKWVTKLEHLKITKSETNWGSGMKGESHGMARLNSDSVSEIRKLYLSGQYRKVDLARKFNITKTHTARILNNKSWAHI